MTHDSDAEANARRVYEDALRRAAGYAGRHVTWDQALEIAHDVAVDMSTRPASEVNGALIYRSVINRLRNQWRASRRRGAVHAVYQKDRADSHTLHADPIARIEARELRQVIEHALARMPDTMREVFALVRQDELTYKEAAAHLGISVGTVHTHLSRANAILRRAIDAYRCGEQRAINGERQR